jgi:hypothetical protein
VTAALSIPQLVRTELMLAALEAKSKSEIPTPAGKSMHRTLTGESVAVLALVVVISHVRDQGGPHHLAQEHAERGLGRPRAAAPAHLLHAP